MHGLNTYDYGARQYNPVTARWDRMDPLCEKYYGVSPYVYCGNDPIKHVDPDDMRKWPVNEKDKLGVHVTSWFGPRNISYGSKFHKGLDINIGYGSQDYGKTVFATHDGIVESIHNNTSGGAGRYISLKSSDGKFSTQYLHLSAINVKVGQKISEGAAIGNIGGSGNGKETGYDVHLH